MEKEFKFFKFEHSEGTEIIIAEFARQAIDYFVNYYMDDLQLDDIAESGGLKIEELKNEKLTEKHMIFNEETNTRELVSYKKIADGCITMPCVIVSPNY
jgi:hypothetical protein